MNFSSPHIVLQEVPGEISLALSISGCPFRCKGCHSTETYDPNFGERLSVEVLQGLLTKHKHISCVLFYGGEWEPSELEGYLRFIRNKGLKTCLYTGHNLPSIPTELLDNLDYLKIGTYKEALGGLGSPNTNQKFLTYEDFKHLLSKNSVK